MERARRARRRQRRSLFDFYKEKLRWVLCTRAWSAQTHRARLTTPRKLSRHVVHVLCAPQPQSVLRLTQSSAERRSAPGTQQRVVGGVFLEKNSGVVFLMTYLRQITRIESAVVSHPRPRCAQPKIERSVILRVPVARAGAFVSPKILTGPSMIYDWLWEGQRRLSGVSATQRSAHAAASGATKGPKSHKFTFWRQGSAIGLLRSRCPRCPLRAAFLATRQHERGAHRPKTGHSSAK